MVQTRSADGECLTDVTVFFVIQKKDAFVTWFV